MSDQLNHLEYVQLTKLYDECLDYLKENHKDLETIIETEEPGYETIKELQSNSNHITKEELNNDENENQVKLLNDFDITDINKSNDLVTNPTNMKIIEINNRAPIVNLNDNDILYETLDPVVKYPDGKIINIITENENKNQLALIKYDESHSSVYETINPHVNFVNNEEENIKIIINNDNLNDSAMEICDEINDSDETSCHVSEEHTDEEKIVVISKVQNLENSPRILKQITFQEGEKSIYEKPIVLKLENEVKSLESLNSIKSERLRKLSQQLPKIIITSSNTSLEMSNENRVKPKPKVLPRVDKVPVYNITRSPQVPRTRKAYGEFPKRLVSKTGLENVALISNVPFEKIRLLNDTFHTLINLRWRWIVIGTVVVHFLIWLVFAMFWYITALAHYDFDPDPPKRSCVTGGKDFVTIFLASVEAQTTIGFGDRAIDEECPEAIFLFIMQLILGTGLSGVLTCVVYAKLTRPEKLSRDGVGFSKKAVISMRDGRLCLMIRAWDLNYDHIISSEFTAHFINTHKTKEGEIIRYYAQRLVLQQRQFLLWPVTLVHVIDHESPLYRYGPDVINHSSYEITVSLKGASASMGTFTQSQTSYLPKEIIWGHRFPPVVRYDCRKQKYVIDHKKLDLTEAVDTPQCSAELLDGSTKRQSELPIPVPSTPNTFSDKMTVFQLGRTSSFRNKKSKT